MASQTSYSIYVRFRGRRLALLRHIRSLDKARAALRALRADRFHDADQVFLVDDLTKEIVDDGERSPRAHAHAEPPDDAGAARSPDGDHPSGVAGRAPDIPPADASASLDVDRSLNAQPAATTQASAPRRDAFGTQHGWVPVRAAGHAHRCADGRERSLTRLRRAIDATQAARARHGAALEAVLMLHRSGVVSTDETVRLETSARAAADLTARALKQLYETVELLERSRP